MKYISINKYKILVSLSLLLAGACSDYLDVVPDNVATVENAFAMRSQAEKYLFTCYSYMPQDGNPGQDPTMVGGDEIWRLDSRGGTMFNIARGFQNVVNPYGGNIWGDLYRGIRDCNIFLENINTVPDIDEYERMKWIAEVKFLKAYYHFYLVRMYGPIPLIKENLPISAGVNQVKTMRAPVDDCFDYIVQLLDEAVQDLPLNILDTQQEAGRITQVIAKSLKAKVLVTAASPLYNGNSDQVTLKNPDGTALFNPTFSKVKWDSAVIACRDAIEICNEAGLELYEAPETFFQYKLTDTIRTQLSIRNSVCERWNSEIIWANTQSYSAVQALAFPPMDESQQQNFLPRGELSPTLKIAEMFYSHNGIPIDEDKTWDFANRYSTSISADDDKLHVRKGYETANLHFEREPRFYASIGFDGGIWYGQGKYDDLQDMDLFWVEAKFGQRNSIKADRSTITGYFIKKLIHFENTVGSGTSYSVKNYPVPIIRLSDLYLLYAEALNEADGPSEDVYHYIDLIRQRAGLMGVEDSWASFAVNPDKHLSQSGLREIIHRERLIELVFEGQRFWDLRRWKEAPRVLNAPIQGWDLFQESTQSYYRPVTILNQRFGIKDYFWPIRDGDITINRNLVQNIGW